MADEWLRQRQDPGQAPLAFDERLALLVDAEWLARDNRRFTRRLQEARLGRITRYPFSEWHRGSSTHAGPLGRAAPDRAHYGTHGGQQILPRVCVRACGVSAELSDPPLSRAAALADGLVARQDGQWFWWLAQLVRYNLPIPEDWAVHPFSLDESRDLLEILDRYQVTHHHRQSGSAGTLARTVSGPDCRGGDLRSRDD